MRLGAGGKGDDLFVTEVQPINPARAPPQRVGEAVQAVADGAVNALDAGGGEGLDHLISNGCGHGLLSSPLLSHILRKQPARD